MASLIGYPADLTYPEGAIVARAWDAARGETPYHDWREWPHAFSPYGPLTYFSAGLVSRAVDPSMHPKKIYAVGRAQSLIALAGICIVLALLTRRIGLAPFWSLAVLAAFLAWDEPITFAASYRPDAPQVFFSLLAILLATGGPARGPRLAASLLILSTAMWFKPTSWGTILAIGYWIAATRGTRCLLISGIIFGASNLLLAALLDYLWRGRLFLNMVGSLDNGWEPLNILNFYYGLFAGRELAALLVLVAGVSFSVYAIRKTAFPLAERIIYLAAAASFLSATIQNLKVGADVNYYLEPLALASVAAIAWLSRLWGNAFDLRSRNREIILWLLVFPVVLSDAYRGLISFTGDLKLVRQVSSPLAPLVQETEGEILVTFPYLALQRPAPPTILDQVQYTILAKRGRIDDRALIERVRRRDFQLMIIATQDETPNWDSLYSHRFLPALRENYEPVQRLWQSLILKPRTEQP